MLTCLKSTLLRGLPPIFVLIIVFSLDNSATATGTSSEYFYPGEALKENEVRVTVVGTGTPFPRRGQAGAAILLETQSGRLLLDAGPGSPANLTSLEIPLATLDEVFISHLHVDHIGGLDSLWIGGWVYGRAKPLKVWGPPGIVQFCDHLVKAYEWDLRTRIGAKLPRAGAKLECKEYVPGQQHSTKGFSVTAFEVVHLDPDHAFGFKVASQGRSIGFSGDTTYSENLISKLRDVDLLIHESFPPVGIYARKTGRSIELTQRVAEEIHISPLQVGKVFHNTKPRLAIVYHLYNNDDIVQEALDEIRRNYRGPLRIAEDLMVINVGDELLVRQAVISDKPWPVGIERGDY